MTGLVSVITATVLVGGRYGLRQHVAKLERFIYMSDGVEKKKEEEKRGRKEQEQRRLFLTINTGEQPTMKRPLNILSTTPIFETIIAPNSLSKSAF